MDPITRAVPVGQSLLPVAPTRQRTVRTNMIPITYETFGKKQFKRYASMAFAKGDKLVPLVMMEIPKAAMAHAVGFVKSGDSYVPVAVLGIEESPNLYVAGDGRWLSTYMPARYRAYPFAMRKTEDGRSVLCFDENSQLMVDEGKGDEDFFEGEGKPSKFVMGMAEFLGKIESSAVATAKLMALLDRHKLITPWPIAVKRDGQDRQIHGLYCVDEKLLRELDKDALYELHQADAMPLVYCQLMSMQNLRYLGVLAKAYETATQAQSLPTDEKGELDLSFLADDTTITFENL